jgi:hypothetical protein
MLNLDTRITLGTTLKILHQYIYVIKIWKRKKDAYDYHGPLFTSLMTSIVATILMYFLSHDPFDFPDFGIHFLFHLKPILCLPLHYILPQVRPGLIKTVVLDIACFYRFGHDKI